MTKKQLYIVELIRSMPNGEATTEEIFDRIPWRHAYYTKNNLGVILSAMIKSRMIHRIRRGVYAVGAGKTEAINVNQINLFDNGKD